MIRRDGALYEEAVDPADMKRFYVETDIDIDMTAEESLDALREVLE